MAFTIGEQDVLVSKLEIDVTDFSRPGYVTTIRVKFQNTKVYEIHLLNIDRKSTRLNSSHVSISYAVFCLKKKNDHGANIQPARQFTCDRSVFISPSVCTVEP